MKLRSWKCFLAVLFCVFLFSISVVHAGSVDDLCEQAVEKISHSSEEIRLVGLKELEGLADQGHARSQYCLAICFADGLGRDVDNEKAVHWMKTSAENGYIKAQAGWGVALVRGERGGPQDYSEAKKWLNLAAGHDEPSALAGLGYLYLNGFGVEKDIAKATEYYERSAALGCEEAQETLRRIRSAKVRSYWPIVLIAAFFLLSLLGTKRGYLPYREWVAAGRPSGVGRLDDDGDHDFSIGGCLVWVILILGVAYYVFGWSVW